MTLWVCRSHAETVSLPQEAYVWQRVWTAPVRDAVLSHASNFSELVLLSGEISWRNSQPALTRIALPYHIVRQVRTPIGLALRINGFAGPFSDTDTIAATLASISASIINDATTNGIVVSELQIDFDCADSKLAGYEQWVRAIKRAANPTPVAITALPSWLDQPGFPALAHAAGGYILQVHSLQRPKSFAAPFTLCDPVVARAAIAQAARIGVPFRVALPTYGYLLAFAPDGQFVGLSAEGPARNWPANARLREVRSDPLALANFARELAASPPATLRGIIWYRLPTAEDDLNWRWPTLDAILHLRLPREKVRGQARRVEAGLYEISLFNEGGLDVSSRLAVAIHWHDARMKAGDGLRGFELVEGDFLSAKLQSKTPARLRASDQWVIGWIRLNNDAEVKLEIKND